MTLPEAKLLSTIADYFSSENNCDYMHCTVHSSSSLYLVIQFMLCRHLESCVDGIMGHQSQYSS